MINDIEITFEAPSDSSKRRYPKTAIRAVPSPDQIAYAMLTSIFFMQIAKKTKLKAYKINIDTVGTILESPSDSFRKIVPATSVVMAIKR
jgi:hypothetical protein